MSDRSDLYTAIGFVLRRLNELGNRPYLPDGQRKSIHEEVKSLEIRWHTLMDRLALMVARQTPKLRQTCKG